MKIVDDTIKDLDENPDEWMQGRCTLSRNSPAVEIWTANVPILNTGFHSPPVPLPFIQKVKLYLAVRKWRASISPFARSE